MSDKKKSLIFYYEWLPLVNSLPDASRLKFYDLIHNPDRRNAVIDDAHLKSIVDFILIKISENEQKYEKVLESKRIAGSMGGKQRVANQADASTSKQRVANQADNVNENENDNVNVNYIKERENLELEFAHIWELYDFKDNRKKALECYAKCQKHYPAICQVIPEYKKYLKASGYKQCSLAVWLNQERWNTDYNQLTEKLNESPIGNNQNTYRNAGAGKKRSLTEQIFDVLERTNDSTTVHGGGQE